MIKIKTSTDRDGGFELDGDVDLASPFLYSMLSVPDVEDFTTPAITTYMDTNREPTEEEWESM